VKLLDVQPGKLQIKLTDYLAKDSRYRAVFEYTKRRFEEADHLPAHNWAHSYRDTLNAIRLLPLPHLKTKVIFGSKLAVFEAK